MEREWQPIETAPKDGRSLLLGGGNICVGDDHKGMPVGVLQGEWSNAEKIWWVGTINGKSLHVKPTHWMPLPEPPSE